MMLILRLILSGWLYSCLVLATVGEELHLELVLTDDGKPAFQLDDAPPVTLAELEANPELLPIKITTENGKFAISVGVESLALAIPGLDGLAVRVDASQNFLVRYDPLSQSLGLELPAGATTPIHLQLHDGSSAVVGPGSAIQIDRFLDGSYALQGRGDVTATSPDDFTQKLAPDQPPFLSGKLEKTGTGSQSHFERQSPLRSIIIEGDPPELSFELEGTKYDVRRTPQTVKLKNGTEFTVKLTGDNLGLETDIKKGVLQFLFPNVGGVQPVLLPRQRAALVLNQVTRTIEVINLSSGDAAFSQNILAALSPSTHASIAPGAIFEFGSLGDFGSFSAGARGNVVLHNSVTGEATPLPEGSLAPRTEFRPDNSAPGKPFELLWSNNQGVVLRSGSEATTVRAETKELIEVDGAIVEVEFDPATGLVIRAAKGNSALMPDLLPGLSLKLTDGAALQLQFDKSSGTLISRSAPGSAGRIIVQNSDGLSRDLSDGSTMTVVIRENSLLGTPIENMIFFEAAGGNNGPFAAGGGNSLGFRPPTSGNSQIPGNSQLPFVQRSPAQQSGVRPVIQLASPSSLDVTRIDQPAVTVE